MADLLTESATERLLRKYLKGQGFEVNQRTTVHGTDIEARHGHTSWVIEVEGNQKPDGMPLKTSQKYTHLLRAVGQICLRMSNAKSGTKFALGLPHDSYYKKKVVNLSVALERLGVSVFWVAQSGKVEST